MGRDLEVGRHLLHVEEFGREGDPPVLYLHGGPGMGSCLFEAVQAERLGQRLRLITLDQRGVLRSSPLGVEEPLGVMDLVEDAEAVRTILGIPRWSLIGHSFGGYLAVLYAHAHPDAVDRLVLENPTLDIGSSARSLFAAAALEYGALGDQAAARTCLDLGLAHPATPARYLWLKLQGLLAGLGPARDNVYVHIADRHIVDRLIAGAPIPPELWERGGRHAARIVEEGRIFTPLLGLLPGIPQETLLIAGQYDHVFAQDQLRAYLAAKPGSVLRIFPGSAHFPDLEEPERFAEEVCAFLVRRS